MQAACHIDEYIPTERIPHFRNGNWLPIGGRMSTSFTNRLPRFVTFEASVPTQETARQDFNTNEPSDEDLIARICRDDKDALASLFRRHARVVWGIANRVLRNSAEADDLVQEIFLLVNRDCRACDISKG